VALAWSAVLEWLTRGRVPWLGWAAMSALWYGALPWTELANWRAARELLSPHLANAPIQRP